MTGVRWIEWRRLTVGDVVAGSGEIWTVRQLLDVTPLGKVSQVSVTLAGPDGETTSAIVDGTQETQLIERSSTGRVIDELGADVEILESPTREARA